MKEKFSFFTKYFDLFIFIIFAGVIAFFQFSGFFDKLDYRLYDGMLSVCKSPHESKNIVLLDADNKSIQDL